jgi:hypothetical protein
MIRNVVFNEYIMFTDSQTSTDSDVSDDEQQRTSMQVEHIEEKENETAKNDDVYHEPQFDDIDNHFVPPSSPVLQQQSHSIAGDRPRRTIAPHKRLLKECNIVYYAMSCVEQVENDVEPATYTEVVASVDHDKWISAMHEEMQSLEKNGTWDIVRLPKHKKVVRCKWIFKERKVCLLKSL